MFGKPLTTAEGKAYHVYRRQANNVPVIVGTVIAKNKTLADTKAQRIFKGVVWTKEKTVENA
jgi:hypothetical protein